MDFDLYEHEDEPRGPSLGRQRLLATALAVFVLLSVSFVIAQSGVTGSSTGTPPTRTRAAAAGVVIVRPDEDIQRIAQVQPIAGGREQSEAHAADYSYPGDGSIISATNISAKAAVRPGARVSSARASADTVELLGGRIKLSAAATTARASVTSGRAGGRISVGDGTTLEIDGRQVDVQANRQVVVPGVGTVAINEQAVASAAPKGDRQTGPRYRVVGSLVHLRVTTDYEGLPAGTQIIIGRTEAGVRQGKVRRVKHASNSAPLDIPTIPAAPFGGAANNPIDIQAGSPKPGDGAIPRKTTSVRGKAAASRGNLQGYVFPVLGHTGYSNDWGAARASTGIPHQGTDIFADEGTPIVAVADGVLDRVGWNTIGGYRFWLYDKYGNGFYHAHLSAYAPLAQDGARVRAGDVIGFVGHTGDAQGTPNHLHFEIHPGNGAATNPFPYLNAWKHGIAIAIDALGLGNVDVTAPLTLLRADDVSVNSGLGQSILGSVPNSADRAIEQEHAPVPTDESLAAAIEGSAIGG